MTDPQTATSRPAFGWLPKLILWGIVLAFGYLYLTSIDRTTGDEGSLSLLDQITRLSPIPISALPGMAPKAPPAPVAPVAENAVSEHPVPKTPDAEKIQIDTAKAQDSRPVNEAESSVFANSLMNKAPVAAPQTVVAQAQAPAIEQPVAQQETPVVATEPLPSVTPPPAPSVEAAAPQRVERRLPSDRHPAAPEMPYDWEAMAWQQAMMQRQYEAQYEAMRREADERMRQYWERLRSSAPVAMPYGYPGYPAGYAPGVFEPQRRY